VQQFPHVKKGVSEGQDVRSWGQKGRSGNQNPLISKRLSASPTIISLHIPPGRNVSAAAQGFLLYMKQLPHVKKGVSNDQDVRSWGLTGRVCHLKSLNFHTPIRFAHNHFIATSHRGEMLSPRLMALYYT
jgi:hypothetical protein